MVLAGGLSGEKNLQRWFDGAKTMEDIRSKCAATIGKPEFKDVRPFSKTFKEDY